MQKSSRRQSLRQKQVAIQHSDNKRVVPTDFQLARHARHQCLHHTRSDDGCGGVQYDFGAAYNHTRTHTNDRSTQSSGYEQSTNT